MQSKYSYLVHLFLNKDDKECGICSLRPMSEISKLQQSFTIKKDRLGDYKYSNNKQ